MELPVAVGQREERYTHLLSGEPDLSVIVVKETESPSSSKSQSNKLAELEARIARIEEALDMPWGDIDELSPQDAND
jgi:uncharacterized protein YceH (UPF0502 family)